MLAHPYRVAAADETRAPARARRDYEEIALAVVLFVVGLAGIAIGVVAGRPLELTLGAILAGLGLLTARSSLRR